MAWLMLAGDAMWYGGPCGEIGDEQRDSRGSVYVAHNCMGVQGKNEVGRARMRGLWGWPPRKQLFQLSRIRVAHDVSCLPVPHVGPLAQVTLPHSRNW